MTPQDENQPYMMFKTNKQIKNINKISKQNNKKSNFLNVATLRDFLYFVHNTGTNIIFVFSYESMLFFIVFIDA